MLENQSPNWASPRPLPSVVQAASGLTLSRGSTELGTVLGPNKALVWEWEVKTRQIEKSMIIGIKFDTVLSLNVNDLIIY